MKKVWKWVLGIFAVLAVIAIIVVVAFSLQHMPRVNNITRLSPYGNPGVRPGMGEGGWGRPMMGRGGFMPFSGLFMGFGMLLAGLLPIGLVAWLVYGAYRLGKRKSASSQPVIPPQAAAPTRACPKCGQFVQDDWNNCANCGKKL